MTHPRDRLGRCLTAGVAGLLFASGAAAQDTAPAAPATPVAAGPAEPTPWYLGGGVGIFHDSNAYRVPDGPGDTYWNTHVFGGFNQRIGRQRVFGQANVGINRYFDEEQLNNTSYDFLLGLDWETVGSLSGSLDAGLRQHLAAPSPTTGVPVTSKNMGKTKFADARVRWGGTSLLTLEGTGRYSSIEYSDPTYAAQETKGASGGLALYYGGGGPLRVGLGGRYDRTETPKALFDPLTGTFDSNTATSRNVDLLADYQVLGQIVTHLRLSYTDLSNSIVEAGDFKGWTGRLGVNWQATGKLAVNAYVARDAGFDSAFRTVPVAPTGPSPGGFPDATRIYENSRLTYSADLGAAYAATGKIDVTVGAHYSRAHVVSTTSDGVTQTDETKKDILKAAYIGANWEIRRNWFATCRLSRELRDVTGFSPYSYGANSIGCSTRYRWP
jgi:hypothetical protein